LAKVNPELGVNLYIDIALAADNMAVIDKDRHNSKALMQIALELMSQGILLHEEDITDSKSQERSVVKIIGALIALKTLNDDEYERLITKATQFSAKLVRKPEQCRMVTLCAHLFYPGVSILLGMINFFANIYLPHFIL
jgi:vacuolar protein sorting-associated protein 35